MKKRTLLIGTAAIAAAAAALLWLSRQPSELDIWMTSQRARGEKFTLAEWGLDRPTPVTNHLQDIVESSSGPLMAIPATARTASLKLPDPPRGTEFVKAHLPALLSASGSEIDWNNAAAAHQSLQPVFQRLHQGLQNPPASSGIDNSLTFFAPKLRNFVSFRRVAQALADATLVALHQEDTAGALEHLLALLHLARAYGEDGLLIDQMIRVAIAGLALDTTWQLLQEPGWADPQLAAFQSEVELLSLLPEYERSLMVERAAMLHLLQSLKEQGANALPATPGRPSLISGFVGHLHFELWRSFWSESDQLSLLRYLQQESDIRRSITAGQPAPQALQACRTAYNDFASQLQRPFGKRFWFSSVAGPNFSRATETVVRIETLRRATLLALALERHRLAHSHYPATLTQIDPAILPSTPDDPFAGGPFHYQIKGPSFLLYSVGPNGTDDQGSVAPGLRSLPGHSTRGNATLTWDAQDAVWPQPAPTPAFDEVPMLQ